jgi:hypothetical protein
VRVRLYPKYTGPPLPRESHVTVGYQVGGGFDGPFGNTWEIDSDGDSSYHSKDELLSTEADGKVTVKVVSVYARCSDC